MMSSEGLEEDENGQRFFVLHKPNFKSKKFEKFIKIIDDAYMGKSSRRSLEQMRRREIGEPSNRLVVICFWKMLMNKLGKLIY